MLRALKNSEIPSRFWHHMCQLGGGRSQYVRAAVEGRVERLLDIGCSSGWLLSEFSGQVTELFGVDIDESVLEAARRQVPGGSFYLQTATTLPFPNELFDVVILSDVIEHVQDNEKGQLIDEAHRVLRNGGMLILTAPYAGMLAWLDPMDFKRRLPLIYGVYMRATSYSPATAVVTGHKHISWDEIQGLLKNRFELVDVCFCGFIQPFLTWIIAVGSRTSMLPKSWEALLNRFRAWESGIRVPSRLAFNIRLKARKR